MRKWDVKKLRNARKEKKLCKSKDTGCCKAEKLL